MRQAVVLDCDGVLLDWEKGFFEWMKRAHPEYTLKTPYPEVWDLHHWIGCDKETAAFLVTQFNTSSFFEFLNPMPGAERLIYELGLRFELYVLTSCSGDEAVRQRRLNNLEGYFGKVFRNVICLPLGMSKMDTLKSFHTVLGRCIWIEDNYQNAAHGFAAGHEAFFLHRPHNKGYQMLRERDRQDITHLENILDILSLIK